jgi:hypothetical protein
MKPIFRNLLVSEKQLIEGEYCSFVSMQAAAYEPYFEIHPVDNLVINGGSARLRRKLAE